MTEHFGLRVANLDGRATLLLAQGAVDLARASDGRISADPGRMLDHLDEIEALAARDHLDAHEFTVAEGMHRLGPPVPNPSQVFAVGLNYRSHGAETGMALPVQPMVFTKFPSAIAAPAATVALPSDTVDWEVELVAVVGTPGRNIQADQAWGHIAALCVGQDLSERTSQLADVPPQFSLAKSFENFAPIGPWLTTVGEIASTPDLEIRCDLDGEVVQLARTSEMLFDIPEIVEFISARCELRVGDLIFTGTPEGVGFSRNPARYLESGSLLRSQIEGLGELRNRTK